MTTPAAAAVTPVPAPIPAPPAAPPLAATTATPGGPPGGARQDGGPGTSPAEPPASPPSASAPAPAELALKLPEGFTEDDAGPVREFAKEHGLSQKQAQAYLDARATERTAHEANLEKIHAGWKGIIKADPDFGGAAYEQTVQACRKFMTKYGTAEERAELDTSKLGDYPTIVKMLARAGKDMGEDSVAGTTRDVSPATDPRENDRRWWPNTPSLWSP